jgi:bacteriorhodopsin
MIYTTGVASLIIQSVIGIIDYFSLSIDVNPEDEPLKDLMRVEFVVQVVEFVFYIWLFGYVSHASTNITLFRYLDWSITTPLMLITLSSFLNHDVKSPVRLTQFLSDHRGSIVKIVLLNALMLASGLIGELGYLSSYITTGLGFIPFILNFKYIKETFFQDSEDRNKQVIFYWFVFFWSLYGLFAVMSHTTKNTGYNILDIFSKNIFGLLLAYILWTKSKVKG